MRVRMKEKKQREGSKNERNRALMKNKQIHK